MRMSHIYCICNKQQKFVKTLSCPWVCSMTSVSHLVDFHHFLRKSFLHSFITKQYSAPKSCKLIPQYRSFNIRKDCT